MRGFEALKTLELPYSLEIQDVEAIRALAALPQLQKLRDLRLNFPRGRAASNAPISGFRLLKDLVIMGDADDVLEFLRGVMSALDTVQMILYSTVSAWLRVSTGISPLLLKSVRELVIQYIPSRTPAPGHTIRDLSEIELVELLRPLLHIRTVETFCLVLRKVGLVSDDDAFETVAKSWPQLRKLWLDVGPSLSTPTFRTLAAFASHCPSLHTLVLPHLDHTSLASELDIRPEPGRAHASFRRLSFYLVDKLRIDDAGSAARFLVDLFPNLDVQACAVLGRSLPYESETQSGRHGGAQSTREVWEEQRRAGAVLWGSVLVEVRRIQDEMSSQ